MWKPGKRVVIRDEQGNDSEVGVVQEIVEGNESGSQKVRVKTSDGGVREVSPDALVEQLED